jgi:hypothetical protein
LAERGTLPFHNGLGETRFLSPAECISISLADGKLPHLEKPADHSQKSDVRRERCSIARPLARDTPGARNPLMLLAIEAVLDDARREAIFDKARHSYAAMQVIPPMVVTGRYLLR